MKKLISVLLLALGFSLVRPVMAATYMQGPAVTGSAHHTGRTGAAKARDYSVAQWRSLHRGRTRELGINSMGFVIDDRELGTSISGIANRLLAQWPGRAPPMALFVLGDKSPLAYGAFTTSSREVFIQYGVLLYADSEDELAAVIGHELAHVLLEHVRTLGYKKNVQQSLDVLTEARDLYAQLDESRYDKDQSRIVTDDSAEKKLRQSAMQQMVANQLYDSVHASLFSREQEYDADRLALDLLVAAAYSPMGLKASLERMANHYSLKEDLSKRMLDRSKELLRQYNSQKSGSDLRLDIRDALIGLTTDTVLARAAQTHPVPEKRVKQMTDYLYGSYPRSARRVQPDEAAIQRYHSGRLAKVLGHYRAASEGLEFLALGEPSKARQSVQLAVSRPTASNAYPRYAAFFREHNTGDRRKALTHLNAIAPTELIPVYASVPMASALADAGESQRSQALMSRIETYAGTVDDYYPIKIKMAKARGDQAKVQQLVGSCQAAASRNRALAEACSRESGIARAPSAQENLQNSIKKVGGSLFGSGKKLLFGGDK